MVKAMMMKMMANAQSMNIRLFKDQFCENVLQILDMTPPRLRFFWGLDEFML